MCLDDAVLLFCLCHDIVVDCDNDGDAARDGPREDGADDVDGGGYDDDLQVLCARV